MGWVGVAHLPPKAMTRSTQTQPMKCKHRNKKAKGKWGGWRGGVGGVIGLVQLQRW
jgi:hypothetical protein